MDFLDSLSPSVPFINRSGQVIQIAPSVRTELMNISLLLIGQNWWFRVLESIGEPRLWVRPSPAEPSIILTILQGEYVR